ncbi:MAG TPA: thioredoxin [Chlamydiales bacterium]|nr:thioredoxin [Chlamydiales bacterium]
MSDLKVILEKTFLSPQSKPLIDMVAMETISESERKIDPEQLTAKFRDYFQSEKSLAKFGEPYKATFTDAEIKQLRTMIETPVWEKYSQQGMQIFQANLECLKDSFKELALTCEPIETAPAVSEEAVEEIAATEETAEVAANENIVDVTKENFDDTVAKSTLPTIVDVNASWCNPCRMMEPIIDDLSEEYKGTIQFAKVDFDSQPDLAKKFGVSSLPTILFFKAGQKTPAMKSVGFMSKADFETKIGQFLKK